MVLFTVLLTSIILAIVVGASGIAYKEVVLASAAKDSSVAFFAADTGLECALHWDVLQTSVFDGGGIIMCDSNDADSPIPISVSYIGKVSNFQLSLDNNQTCASVTVEKEVIGDSGNSETHITSLGYNVPCTEIGTSNRVVERAVGVIYEN